MTRGDLTATAWRKAKTLLQLSEMVPNVLAVVCFALPFFIIFSSSASTPPLLLSSLSLLSSPMTFPPSFDYSVMERAKIFRSSPASNSPLWIAASVRNGGRTTALRGVQSRYLFKRARFLAAVRRRTSGIWRRILSLSAAKAMSILVETTEGESTFPARTKSKTDSPREIFPTVA